MNSIVYLKIKKIMKNNILFKIAYPLFFVSIFYFTAFGQNSLSTIYLPGPGSKMAPVENEKRFSVMPEFGYLFPHQSGIESYNGGGMDGLKHKIYSQPQLLEQLFEKLGGEFVLGSLSGVAEIENFQQNGSNYFGISGAYRLNNYLATAIHFSAYKTQVTAEFPFLVFDEMTFEPVTRKGDLSTDLQNHVLQLSGNYYPIQGNIQPFAGVGVIYSSTKVSETKAQIGGVAFDLSENPAMNSLGVSFNAGLSVNIFSHVVVQLNGRLFSVSSPDSNGMVWNKSLGGGIGVRF